MDVYDEKFGKLSEPTRPSKASDSLEVHTNHKVQIDEKEADVSSLESIYELYISLLKTKSQQREESKNAI